MDLHSKLRSAPCHCTGQARGTSKPFKLRTNDENFVLLKDDFAAHKQFTGRAPDNSAAPSAVMEYIIIKDDFSGPWITAAESFLFSVPFTDGVLHRALFAGAIGISHGIALSGGSAAHKNFNVIV